MFPRAVLLGRIAGVAVRADPGALVIAVLIVWSFLTRFSTGARPASTAVMMALLAGLGFFASLLAHELAHALEARHRGHDVHAITLFLFGGATEYEPGRPRARDELAVAAVGPYASLVTAATLGLVTAALDEWVPAAADLTDVTGVLAWLNVALAVFNLVPGSPLDGGKVLRSMIWAATGNRARATALASWSGQAVAAVLWAAGLLVLRDGPSNALSAGWLAVTGMFLWFAAVAERRAAAATLRLQGHTAALLAEADARPSVGDHLLLGVAEPRLTADGDVRTWQVVADDGSLVGALTLAAVTGIPPLDRAHRSVGDVMIPLAELPRVTVEAPLTDVIEQLQHADVVAIIRGDEIVALVDDQQARACLERIEALGIAAEVAGA